MTLLFGLIGFSIVVVVHELGHFFAAKWNGVEVEAFSIGWGPTLYSSKRGGTEWKIAALPVGGYCRMRGEESFRKALERKDATLDFEAGSFHSASPLRRISILLAGPLANLLLAVILFSAVSLAGITIHTAPNRIILASEFETAAAGAALNPADAAGFQSGDRVLSIGGRAIRDYSDLQEAIALNPGKDLAVTLERGGVSVATRVTPRLDKASGQGLVGVYAWIDPTVESVEKGGAADIAGFLPGDRIETIGGIPVRHTIDISAALAQKPEKVKIGVSRDNLKLDFDVIIGYDKDGKTDLGLSFVTLTRVDRAKGLPDALSRGIGETGKTIVLTVKGIGLLFSGVDVLKALSGPARITYYVGATATESIKSSGLSGIPTILNFLAFLSVGLFFMNLLPIPVLDGGQVVLALAEGLKGSPLRVRTLYRYQFVGTALLMVLLVVATLGDLFFFTGR